MSSNAKISTKQTSKDDADSENETETPKKINSKSKKCKNSMTPSEMAIIIKEEQEFNEQIKFKSFYTLYRLKQRISGATFGAVEGFLVGISLGGKWGGGGGFIVGGIMQLLGAICGPCIGLPAGTLLGLMSDKHILLQLMKDYKMSLGSGGGRPPTHTSLE